MGSRFVATQIPSRFFQVAAAQVSRFLGRHPTLSRFIAHIPGVSRFMSVLGSTAARHIAPVYNRRAQKPRWPGLGM
jgi:hypothetical protein